MTCAAMKADMQQRVFTYLLSEDMYITGGAINNGGIVLEWLDKLILDEDPATGIHRILELAATAPAGAGGLLFLPYILGERAPMWDANAKGVFFGLNNRHTKADLTRATVEGICFAMRGVIDAIEETNGSITNIYASGGFIKSSFWLQLLADILGKKMIINNSTDASSTGAAIIGMQALGLISNLSDANTFFIPAETYTPEENTYRQYESLFTIFRSLYPKLKDDFEAISRVQRIVV